MADRGGGDERVAGDAAGRVALVTGANRGLGLAIAQALAAAGHRVAATTRAAPPEGHDDLLWVRCDVRDPDSVDAAVGTVEDRLGPVEVLVANAGVNADGLLLRMSEDDFTSVVDTNLGGAFRVAKRAAAKMVRARWGRVVLISSVVGQLGQAGQANYAASKAGLVGLARSMARELASRNVCVNVVAPGPLPTEMVDSLSDEQRAAIVDHVPLGRLGRLEEVAATVVFLASEDAGYITGAVIGVDGGLGMG